MKMTKEEVARHNEKVDYNKSAESWIMDIVCCFIFFPMIIYIVYRRGRYNNYQKINDGFD